MNPRVLKGEIDKIKQTDVSQETDITALETAVGSVAAEGDDLQTQVTKLEARVKALEDAQPAAAGAGEE